MFSKIKSGTIYGLEGFLIDVEVDFSQGLPCFVMVGSLAGEVRESAERVRIALKNVGISIPPMHIAVNLSPADIKKSGTGFDLPIALAVLLNMGELDAKNLNDTIVLGELGLNGEVKSVNGVMPIIWEAKKNGMARCIVPKENEQEALLVDDIEVIGAENIIELLEYLREPYKNQKDIGYTQKVLVDEIDKRSEDFGDVSGQENIKRGALIAASGFHHLLIIGPPGTGKTMIAKRIPGIIPQMSVEESMEVTSIYSIAGKLGKSEPVKWKRPFVAPHHTISPQGMAGGGRIPRPGAVSLAHRGVLFLDELPEFQRASIDMLRQPLEEKSINISRAVGSFTYPADFMLVAAMNPCPCGYYPDMNKCNCTPWAVKRYLGNISGPILDRIDLCVTAQKIKIMDIHKNEKGLTSDRMRQIVSKARKCQEDRYANERYKCNSELDVEGIRRYCPLDDKNKKLLEDVCNRMDISVRAYHRLLRVARTIADIEGEEKIREEHLLEAICYRPQFPGVET